MRSSSERDMSPKLQPQTAREGLTTLAEPPPTKTPANSSVTGLNMTSINTQPLELKDADTRNAIAYALQKLHENKNTEVSLLMRQQNFGLFTLILHLTLKGVRVTTVTLQQEAGVHRKTVAKYVELLLEEQLIVADQINNRDGKGRLWRYQIHPAAITDISAMRSKKPSNRS
jgi:predicted transcriptional regulator